MSFFTIDELTCKDAGKTPYPEAWRKTRWPSLQETLNTIREAWGHPLQVLSGYRTEAYNKSIGGAALSQHVQGRACDIRPANWTGDHREIELLHKLVLRLHREGKLPHLGGLGKYAGFVHVDTRPGKKLVQWNG